MSDRPSEQTELRCQMCGTAGRPKATHCLECGAALPLTELAPELVIPGVTHLDPNLESYANQPLHMPRATASEALAPGAIHAAVAVGGPPGLALLGVIGAVAASELSARSRRRASLDRARLGEPSAAARELARRLQEEQASRVAATKSEPAAAAGDAAAADNEAGR